MAFINYIIPRKELLGTSKFQRQNHSNQNTILDAPTCPLSEYEMKGGRQLHVHDVVKLVIEVIPIKLSEQNITRVFLIDF